MRDDERTGSGEHQTGRHLINKVGAGYTSAAEVLV